MLEEAEMKTHHFTLTTLLVLVLTIPIQPAVAPGSEADTYKTSMQMSAEVPIFVQDNRLVYESGATYQWLDPHVSYYLFDYWTLWHSVETLLWYERDNATKTIPWLAESVDEIAVGGEVTQYNLTLRQGITFQDGTPFNAAAVWFSLNRLLIIDGTSGDGLNHGSQAAWMVQQLLNGSLAKGVSGYDQPYDAAWVRAVLDQEFVIIFDDYHIRLNLMTSTTQFYPILAGPWAGIISPAATIEMDYEAAGWDFAAEQTPSLNFTKYFERMAGKGDTGLALPEDGWKIGSGPYYVESVEAIAPYTTVLKAYDDYWGGPDNMNLPPAGETRIGTIEYRYVPSFTTRLLDLEAGVATGIMVPTANIFQVVDRDRWIDEGVFGSLIPDVTMHGPFSQFTTWWLCFNTNVTNPDGTLKDWQPFADWRMRMAAACSVNITEMNINANNRLGIVASSIVPPGTYPPGSYNPDVGPTFSFNLTRAEEMLNASRDDPVTSFTFYENGTAVPPSTIDNSFGPSFADAKIVEFYVQSGADQFQAVLTAMADNLNAIAKDHDLGIRFSVVVVPGGQQYVLASQHLIDSYMGGWIADYNHVLDWLAPMFLSTGTYFSWNLWNLTALDTRYADALLADQAGDLDELLRLSDEMNMIANEALTYMVWWHPTLQFARSEWLQGWYVNTNYGVDLWSSMYYETPLPSGARADLARRGAWSEHHRFVLARDGNLLIDDRHGTPGYQTLYSAVKNTGNVTLPAGMYKTVWTINDSTGNSRTAETVGTVNLAPGELTVLAFDVSAVGLVPGKCYVAACCHYYRTEGERLKIFSFTVVRFKGQREPRTCAS